jgi:hypothetical protein
MELQTPKPLKSAHPGMSSLMHSATVSRVQMVLPSFLTQRSSWLYRSAVLAKNRLCTFCRHQKESCKNFVKDS